MVRKRTPRAAILEVLLQDGQMATRGMRSWSISGNGWYHIEFG